MSLPCNISNVPTKKYEFHKLNKFIEKVSNPSSSSLSCTFAQFLNEHRMMEASNFQRNIKSAFVFRHRCLKIWILFCTGKIFSRLVMFIYLWNIIMICIWTLGLYSTCRIRADLFLIGILQSVRDSQHLLISV